MRFRNGTLVAAALAALACTFSREITILPHRLSTLVPIGLVNSYNAEEQLQRGYIPEVSEFLAGPGGRGLDAVRLDRLAGQVLLERGDFRGAAPRLERAFAGTGRGSDRADISWLLSQAAYWDGDFPSAGRWGRVSQREGKRVPDGWLVFLESQGTRVLYGGAAAGERFSLPVEFGRPNLLRVAVRVNGRRAEEMIVDSGASLSLLTESAAARLGVSFVPGATAVAKGLHDTDLPMRLGWVDSVRVGDLTLTDVPFGVLPDGTLTFETTSSGVFRLNGVLGVHLMKELDWRIEFTDRLLQAQRLDRRVLRGSKDQNLFFRRMKPMARASLDGRPWSLFLLDTGSEPSMITRVGLQKGEPVSRRLVPDHARGDRTIACVVGQDLECDGRGLGLHGPVQGHRRSGRGGGDRGRHSGRVVPFFVRRGDPVRRDDARAGEPGGAPSAPDEAAPAGNPTLE